jgi:hypothetical protein
LIQKYPFYNNNYPPPSKFLGLVAVYTTVISRNEEFPPEEVSGNKDQFKSLSSKPPQTQAEKYV